MTRCSPGLDLSFMFKPAVVLLLVVGLLLTAFPAALSADGLVPSARSEDEPSSQGRLDQAILASVVEAFDVWEAEEDLAHGGLFDRSAWFHEIVPALHLLSADAHNADRSREPALVHGRSPPCSPSPSAC